MKEQPLPLALSQRPAYAAGDLFVSASNQAALAWLDRWPDWPAPGLVLVGPAGCGKSHLAAVWQARSQARRLTDEEPLPPDNIPLVIEQAAQRVGTPAREEALFHTYNRLAAHGVHFLLTDTQPPAAWSIGLADLRSRLLALPVAAVERPDDALLSAMLIKQFADRQLRAPTGLVDWLLLRLERSGDAVLRAVATLDEAALMERHDLTIPFARRVLGPLLTGAGTEEA